MQTRTHNPFTTIHTEGVLLPVFPGAGEMVVCLF